MAPPDPFAPMALFDPFAQPSLSAPTKATALRWLAASARHQGDKPSQQDELLLVAHPRDAAWQLAALSDGMGGLGGGELAAQLAIATAAQLFEAFEPEQQSPEALLEAMVNQAHEAIRGRATAKLSPHCTLVLALLHTSGTCSWVVVGDSRFYHYERANLVERSMDHSVVQTLMNQGQINGREAEHHPKRNLLVAALGAQRKPPVQVRQGKPLRPHDAVLLCSDGLWGYFDERELGEVLYQFPPQEAVDLLVAGARERARGQGDNLSLIVVKVLSAATAGASTSAASSPPSGSVASR